jgi:hypothetical protein
MTGMGKGASRGFSIARWVLSAAILVGGAYLVYRPFQWSAELAGYADQLRRSGEPIEAHAMVHVESYTGYKGQRKSYTVVELDYEFHDTKHRLPLDCDSPCPHDGDKVMIWVNPNDPVDYVDQYGTLSGDRNDFPALLGLAGIGVIFLGFAVLLWPLFRSGDRSVDEGAELVALGVGQDVPADVAALRAEKRRARVKKRR